MSEDLTEDQIEYRERWTRVFALFETQGLIDCLNDKPCPGIDRELITKELIKRKTIEEIKEWLK